jgi:rhombotail lipoprotein
MFSKSRINCILILLVLFPMAGCAEYFGSRHNRYTSSVVDYLYPKKEVAATPAIPHLSLPLNVGIAFVPESGMAATFRLSQKDKMDLMNRISSEFRTLPFINNIELIPTDYLTVGGGFANLDQIRTMYGIDVIALISYDQVQHTDEGLLSLSYWTIIGAYAVKGEKNDTSTMVDAVLVDIASRKMLFRAPGTSRIKASSTLVNLSEQMRNDSLKGFESAANNLVQNLQAELNRFKQKVKETPKSYAIEHKPGYGTTGGGSLGAGYALTLLFLGGCALWSGRKE